VILLHDCVPFDMEMTTRDIANLPRGAWTGDVWKLVPILLAWRPELTLTVLDCQPTGLVCVSGLDPKNRVLAGSYDRIVAEFRDMTMEDFGVERFFGLFRMASARTERHSGFPLFRPASIPEDMKLEPQAVTP
jgi:hypothetical protein